MNAAQTSLYFFEWGRVRRHFLAQGIDPKQVDHKRHALHAKALGRDKSSKQFTNPDLDKVIATFRAITQSDDLNAQLAQIDQPENRRADLLEDCRAACWEMYQLGDNRLAAHAESYIAGTARNVIKKELAACTDAELALVRGCLRRRVGVLRKNNPTAAASIDATRERDRKEQPF